MATDLIVSINTYLREEIAPLDLAELIDGHREEMVQHLAQLGEPWTQEQASMHLHLGRWRDMILEISKMTASEGKDME